jgi:hypothetical protein
MDEAALVLGTARHARERSMSKTLPFDRTLVEGWLDEAQRAVGEERWAALLGQGGAMDIAAALELAGKHWGPVFP